MLHRFFTGKTDRRDVGPLRLIFVALLLVFVALEILHLTRYRGCEAELPRLQIDR